VEIKVVSKGYTIKVVSWENDGDSQWEKISNSRDEKKKQNFIID